MIRLAVLLFIFLNSLLPARSWAKFNIKYYPNSLADCKGPNTIPMYGSDFCNMALYLQQNIIPKSPDFFLNTEQVILFGDTHPNRLLKRWLASNLQKFRLAGFTHVGLEAVNSENQTLLDHYKDNPSLRAKVLQVIADEWGWIPEDHLALIDAINESGLHVVAIDNRKELENKGHGEAIELRNFHMAKVIQSAVQRPQAGRMLVLTGKVHSSLISDVPNEKTLPEALKILGVSSLSIDLESPELLVPSMVTQAFVLSLLGQLVAFNTNGEYYLPVPTGNSVDGIIFVSDEQH